MQLQRIGFIGVGNIGAPMAERLIERGCELLICDRSAQARDRFSKIATVVETASECAGCDVVIAMVANDDQLRSAILGADGLASGIGAARPPRLAIMSTVMPQTAVDVAAALAGSGIATVDAPVSGGAIRARKGTLAIMVGGDEADYAELLPVFDMLGSQIHHCGGLGSGELTKILNNLVGVANLYLFAEAMQIGARHGLDLGRLSAIMETGSGRNNGTKNWGERQELYRYNARDPETMGALVQVTRKDLQNAVALAAAAGLETPLLEAVANSQAQADPMEILRTWREVGEWEAAR